MLAGILFRPEVKAEERTEALEEIYYLQGYLLPTADHDLFIRMKKLLRLTVQKEGFFNRTETVRIYQSKF